MGGRDGWGKGWGGRRFVFWGMRIECFFEGEGVVLVGGGDGVTEIFVGGDGLVFRLVRIGG